MHIALTIGGSDSGGGAGIQADLKTFEAHNVFGTSVITAVTAQNTLGVQGVFPVNFRGIEAQLQSVLGDMKVRAAKTGMLYSADTIGLVAHYLRQMELPLVVDPVMVATSGDALMQQQAVEALVEELLPLATIVTPNLHEAETLAGIPISSREDMEFAARILGEKLPDTWILIKGGHLEDEPVVPDLLFRRDYYWMESPRIRTRHTHGTGCTLSAAIAANLARRNTTFGAVKDAKSYVQGAIQHALKNLGEGRGSLKHNHRSFATEE